MSKKYTIRYSKPVVFIVYMFLLLVNFINAEAQTTTIYPNVLTSSKGYNSGQGLGVLQKLEQEGSQDNWDAYIEFTPGSKQYIGDFKFALPANFSPTSLTSLVLGVNYRGPQKAYQRWLFQIKNFSTSKWVNLGDNSGAGDWIWTLANYSATGTLSNYISSSRGIEIRYKSSNSFDASLIDFIALKISGNNVTSDDNTILPPTVNEDETSSNTGGTNTSDDSTNNSGSTSTTISSSLTLPRGTTWQIQLSGDVDTSRDVRMYDIDLYDTSEATISSLKSRGSIVICYYSAGSFEDWRPDAGQFPAAVLGRTNGWPGEQWLDIRQIDQLAPIMRARLDLAVQKGCDGVDPDNVDGFSNNTGFSISYQDQLAYNIWTANEAHARGLLIGLKNDVDQTQDLVNYYDFAVNEQCMQYNECGTYVSFVNSNKAVFNIEYSGTISTICATAQTFGLETQKKGLDLDASVEDCHEQ